MKELRVSYMVLYGLSMMSWFSSKTWSLPVLMVSLKILKMLERYFLM